MTSRARSTARATAAPTPSNRAAIRAAPEPFPSMKSAAGESARPRTAWRAPRLDPNDRPSPRSSTRRRGAGAVGGLLRGSVRRSSARRPEAGGGRSRSPTSPPSAEAPDLAARRADPASQQKVAHGSVARPQRTPTHSSRRPRLRCAPRRRRDRWVATATPRVAIAPAPRASWSRSRAPRNPRPSAPSPRLDEGILDSWGWARGVAPEALKSWGFGATAERWEVATAVLATAISPQMWEGSAFPGFMIPAGSNARRSAWNARSSASPKTIGRYSFFSIPMPCSPESVPPSATQALAISSPARSTRATSSASRPS